MIARIFFWMLLMLLQQRRAMMSNYTLTQWPAELGPLHQGDPVHLLCSVLFDQKNDTCAGRHSVHWLRVGSHSGLSHADGKTNEECDEMSPKQCIYKFFINVSESDGATYYCALQVCGNFMFANGTKLDLLENVMPVDNSHKEILLFSSILAFCLLVVALLINIIMKKDTAAVSTQSKNPGDYQGWSTFNRDEDSRLNSAVIFTVVESKMLDTAERRKLCLGFAPAAPRTES